MVSEHQRLAVLLLGLPTAIALWSCPRTAFHVSPRGGAVARVWKSGGALGGQKQTATKTARFSVLPAGPPDQKRGQSYEYDGPTSAREVARPRPQMDTQSTSAATNTNAYVELLRPQNVVPSMMLVAVGSLLSTHDPRHLLDPAVLSMAVTSALVAVGSCVLNDFFDRRIDAINKPDRTLVQGAVPPSAALMIGTACLGVALLASLPALAPSLPVRRIVRAAVLAVTLYTPLFKPVPFLKNAVVAAVVAGSLIVGSLASGASVDAALVPASVVFLYFYHREILMDIDDVEGDAECGILTVPRLLGRPGALFVATGMVLTAAGVCVSQLLASHAASAAAASAAVVAGALATAAAEYNIARNGFRSDELSRAIAWTPVQLLVMLAALGLAPL